MIIKVIHFQARAFSLIVLTMQVLAMTGRFSRILVVDDSATTRKVVCGMLRILGYDNIHEASDGRQALSMLMEKRYALVISDWAMEPMNGLELLRELREQVRFGRTPFIMMTAHAIKFAAIARDDGSIHYLIKPFKPEQLAARIHQAMMGVAA